MVNISFTRGHGRTVAVVDVHEGGASVAILSAGGYGPSTVWAYAHSTLSLEPRTDAQALARIGEEIAEAAKKAQDTHALSGRRGAIQEVYVVLHAPWIKSRAVVVQERFETDTYIKDEHIAKLAHTALSEDKTINRSNLIEGAVVRIELNGYPTAKPVGKYAHSIDVVSLLSEGSPNVRDTVGAALKKAFPVAKLFWRSNVRALMTYAREGAISSRHYTVIDMGADTTHIISVRGVAFAQRVVPEGIRTILAKVAGGRSPEDVLTTMRMLARDACATESCEALQKALASIEPELLKVFGGAIGELAATRRAANQLLLITHPDLEDWFSNFFSRIDFSQFTATTLPFSVSTPSSIGTKRWIHGECDDSLVPAVALVNIEERA